MAYFHGVRVKEIPTSILATVSTTAGLPVVFGTAPVHLTKEPAKYVSKPVICYSWDEAVTALGYSADWSKYTLSEVMYSEFKLYAVKPIVFVNVLDPAKHKKSMETAAEVVEGSAVIDNAVLLDSLQVLPDALSDTPAEINKDYTAAYNDDGQLVISILEDGSLKDAASIFIKCDVVDASMVSRDDIIGGASSDGSIKGMELIDSIYTMLSLVPGIIAAPGWSEDPVVAAVMKAKSANISELFRCICLTDVDTREAKSYLDVNEWKNKNNYTGTNQVVCWPCVRNGDAVFHMSTHILGVIGVMDAANSDVPYQSPSNQSLQATGLCLADGTEVALSLPQANLLNSQGIMTGLNFVGGWKSWGNYTGCYPSNTDVKDCFICVRRMFDWQYQTFILQYWQKVDQALKPTLIKTIVNTENIRLNGLVSRGYLLGASVQFLEDENPTTDLLAGIIRVHTKLTPPVPAQDIEDILEYDVSSFSKLFE